MAALSPEQQAELVRDWSKRTVTGWASYFQVSPGVIRGRRTRLNLHSTSDPSRVKGLPGAHAAAVEGRSVFPGRVAPVPANTLPRRPGTAAGGFVLQTGANSVKLGGGPVTKGAWHGMPIYSLALEERATCPRSCENWLTCYGNGSHWQTRYQHGDALEQRLAYELEQLQRLYPGGFIVRLHTLGDFYSIAYVALWGEWLNKFPALRVFGYTAREPWTPIGNAVQTLAAERWDRFALRWSGSEPGPGRAITLRSVPTNKSVVVCPAQTGRTRCCATCGLCWAPAARDKTIGFLLHGR